MSNARKCDRCGRYYGMNERYLGPKDDKRLFNEFDQIRIYRSGWSQNTENNHYDLCPKCQEELWKWLNMANKPATADAISDGYHTFGELYEHRNKLFAVIVNEHKDISWKSRRHSDGEPCFGGGWFIVGIETPEGQYAYHVKGTPENWDMFHVEDRKKAKKYDGHKPKDIERLFSLILPEMFHVSVTPPDAKIDVNKAVDRIAKELRKKGGLSR